MSVALSITQRALERQGILYRIFAARGALLRAMEHWSLALLQHHPTCILPKRQHPTSAYGRAALGHECLDRLGCWLRVGATCTMHVAPV